MDIIISESITIHLVFIYILITNIIINLYSVHNVKDFIKLAKRLKFQTPFYHTINGIVLYSGTIIAFFMGIFNFTVSIMIAASIALLVLEIKRYKKMRVIKTTDIQLQEEFVVFAKKIYLIEFTIIASTYIIATIF